MDDCNGNQSGSKSPPLHGLPLIDFSSIASGDYPTGRLSKVTEENSNSNNTTNSLCEYEYEYDEKEDTSSTPRPDSLSLGAFDPGSLINSTTSYIRYIEQLNRHNNTPHYNEETEQKHDFIPERIRILLDEFAANGYIISNAPPPANKQLIDSIPERIVDTTDINAECAICMLRIIKHDIIKTLSCKHYFHSRCIVTWLHIHASCPLCRYPLNGTETTSNRVTETPETHSETNIINRLRELRSHRWNRNSNNRNRRTTNDDNEHNNDQLSAATQLITAVCDILNQYNLSTQNVNMDDISRRNMNERVVRFNHRPPPPPHSSRSNTKTRISLPDLNSPHSSRFHTKNNSSPYILHEHQDIDQDDDDDNDDEDDDKEEIISATKIKEDFANWMKTKRRSRLSINCKSPPELTPESSHNNTIIYNSNFNQNYIYNNNYDDEIKLNYGEMDGDDDIYDIDDVDNDYDEDIYCLMSNQQLEIAERRHKNIISKQMVFIDQIQKEQNKRMLSSFWKCAQCRSNRRAYLILPCRHLGLCIKCNALNICKINSNKCNICSVQIIQKIQINFSD